MLCLENEFGYPLPAGDGSGDPACTSRLVIHDDGRSVQGESVSVQLGVTAFVEADKFDIFTELEGFVDGDLGPGELQSWGRLKSITVSNLS